VTLLDRIRRFWAPAPEADHPLSAEERDEDRPETAYDERADTLERLAGGDFDPDRPPTET
jgi:hypothetical protein